MPMSAPQTRPPDDWFRWIDQRLADGALERHPIDTVFPAIADWLANVRRQCGNLGQKALVLPER